MSPPRSQRGLAAATIVIVLILAAVALAVGHTYFRPEAFLNQREATDANLRRVSEALAQFASLNQRLPCPAAGTADSGLEDDSTGIANCNSGDGVVPWATLALSRSTALDGWGRKISYRVFAGVTGLTQAGGLSMTDCNTNAAATGTVTAAGRCNSSPRDTRDASYLAYRALAANSLSLQRDAGTTSGHAFVLISHGESGVGAFCAECTIRSTPPATTALEYRNTQAGTTFDSRSRSALGVAATDATFFDDVVLATSIVDVVNAARLTARDWGAPPIPPPIASQSFGASDLAAVLGYTPDPTTDASTNQNDIDFGAFRVRAFGSTGRDVSFGQGVSGTGIGSIGSTLTDNQYSTINAATSESLRFQFVTPGRYLGITLVDFGTQSGDSERVRFTFNVGGSSVQIVRTACRAGDVLANYTLNPGGDFDEVIVESLNTSSGVTASQFLIRAISTCTSGNPSCSAPGAVSGDNCP